MLRFDLDTHLLDDVSDATYGTKCESMTKKYRSGTVGPLSILRQPSSGDSDVLVKAGR